VNALFMAVTARTAGFNTVDYDVISNPAVFLTLALMWIGGAPASVAGGVKITTVALLGLLLWARLRGQRHVSLASRTVPAETVQRAAGLAAGAVLLLGVFLFLLLETEGAGRGALDREHFIRLVFEIQSAFSTVGLSMGVTPDLSPAGRLLLVPLMVLGRIGPLVVLSAMVIESRRRASFRHAHEDVLVG
jgi:trk system potassium uptake protein TrkH